MWNKGLIGRTFTPHRSDGTYSARAELIHDSPPHQELVRVKLLEDFYCCEAGEVIETQRYLFKPIGTTTPTGDERCLT